MNQTERLQALIAEVQSGQVSADILIAELETLQGQIEAQAEIIKTLRRDSMIDPLTGGLNRKGFEIELKKSLANAQRHKRLHMVLFLDLDNFKDVNKKYGRYAGDEALCHVYELLKANTRQTDIISRLGGDEFCIILNDVRSTEDAAKRGEILRQFIGASPVPFEGDNIWLQGHLETQEFYQDDDLNAVLARIEQITPLRRLQTLM